MFYGYVHPGNDIVHRFKNYRLRPTRGPYELFGWEYCSLNTHLFQYVLFTKINSKYNIFQEVCFILTSNHVQLPNSFIIKFYTDSLNLNSVIGIA